MIITLTDENFEKEISSGGKEVFVDFWMPGCGPCLLLSPIIDKLAKDFGEKIIFAKIKLIESPVTAQKYGVNVAPTVILFKGGKAVSGFIGLKPEPEIRKWLEVAQLIQEYEKYAREKGFSLNPNRKAVEGIVKSLLEREKNFGAKYCPCRRVTGRKEEDKKIICPCVYHLEEIEKDGHCLCGLFVK